MAGYRGRFAPSPSGLLHAGSVVAALASWLDARAHGGRWLVRIEDVDAPRCVPGADAAILGQLAALGLHADEPPLWQSARSARYAAALAQLVAQHDAYPCGCTRAEIALAAPPRPRHAELVYPGTCRDGLHGKPARAWRLRTDRAGIVEWHDRRLGAQQQNVGETVGDVVLKRADGLWAYQLAVVVDDAEQAITHVVRGEDLADNTPRQILLQRALGLGTRTYLHTPLVLAADGAELSSQNGATPIAADDALATLDAAGRALGLRVAASTSGDWLAEAVTHWRANRRDNRNDTAGWHDASSATTPQKDSP